MCKDNISEKLKIYFEVRPWTYLLIYKYRVYIHHQLYAHIKDFLFLH